MEVPAQSASALCANCQKSQAQLDEPLKRCARCQSIRYCSTPCQRDHWPQHKTVCTRVVVDSEPGRRQRAITRLRPFATLSDFENETIFFVEKSTPHLDDITIAGPFYPRQATVEQIQGYMHKVSHAGMASICDLAEDPERLHQLEHIKAPLNADPSKFIIVRVIERHDAAMASRLPGPAFNVLRAVPLMPQEAIARNAQLIHSPHPRVKAVDIVGCFATLDEAKAKAAEQAGQVEKELQGVERIGDVAAHSNGSYSTAFLGRDSSGKPSCVIIEVRFDSGSIVRWV